MVTQNFPDNTSLAKKWGNLWTAPRALSERGQRFLYYTTLFLSRANETREIAETFRSLLELGWIPKHGICELWLFWCWRWSLNIKTLILPLDLKSRNVIKIRAQRNRVVPLLNPSFFCQVNRKKKTEIGPTMKPPPNSLRQTQDWVLSEILNYTRNCDIVIGTVISFTEPILWILSYNCSLGYPSSSQFSSLLFHRQMSPRHAQKKDIPHYDYHACTHMYPLKISDKWLYKSTIT